MESVEKEIEEYEQKRWEEEKLSTKFIKTIKPHHFVLIIIFVFMAIFLYTKPDIDKRLILFVGGGIGAVVAYLIFANQRLQKKLISESKAKVISQRLLEEKIGTELPTGTKINSTLFCKLRYLDAFPWKWEIGYELTYPNFLKKYMMVILHPFDGINMGIIQIPAGYDGREATDIKIVYPKEFLYEESKVPPQTK